MCIRVLTIAALTWTMASTACSSKASKDGDSTTKHAGPSGALGGPLAGATPPPPAAPAPAATLPFTGAYSGSIQGAPAQLTMQRSGDTLTGTIVADGYRYDVSGKVSDTSATGTLSDPASGAALPFQATTSDGNVRFVVRAEGTQLELAFHATGGTATAPPPAAAVTPPAPSAPTATTGEPARAAARPAGGGQRDPRLVGSWSYTESLGDAQTGFGNIRWQLIVRPDGTYSYGNDRSQTNGHWRTQGNVVQVSEDGASWEPYARFTADGGRMLFTLGDGTKQLWHRR